MNEKVSSYFLGRLTFDRLFVGSKSERLYPVLHTEQGHSYRLHSKEGSFGDENSLSLFADKTVKVHGLADNTRGHWRIVLEGKDSCVINEVLSEKPNGTAGVVQELKLTAPKASGAS